MRAKPRTKAKAAVKTELEDLEEKRQWAYDNAREVYEERDFLIGALARVYPSHRMATGKDRLAVCIHSPAGQLAWNFPQQSKGVEQVTGPTLRESLSDLELKPNDWDQAKTADRRERLQRLANGTAK